MKKISFLFPLLFLFIACQKEITNDVTITTPGSSSGTASYKLSGAGSTCTGFILSGTYQAGTAMVSADSVVLQVTVDTIGTYNLSTNTTNGIAFSGSGTFVKTGIQTITLTATGIPTAAGNFVYTPPVGTGCNFTVTVSATTTVASSNCKSCSYMPYCDGIRYVYIDTFGTAASERRDTLKVLKDTTIDGKTFSKTTTSTGRVATFYNCTDGATRTITYNGTTVSGNTIAKTDLTFIKANLAVGGSWTDTIVNSAGQNVEYKNTIVEKGISRTVLGVIYNNVIHVHTSIGIDLGLTFGGFYETNTSDYYFSNNIGLIEDINTFSSSGTTLSHTVLKSYYIP